MSKEERDQKRAEDRARKYSEYHDRHAANRRTVRLLAPYWRIGGGFESTVVLNNTFPRDIELTPEVYADDGRRLPARTISLKKMASISVPLRDLVSVEGQGQVSLSFYGEPLEVHGSVVITNAAQSLSFNHRFEKRSDFSSSRLDGVFYVPSPSSGGEVAISNVSNQPVEVALLVRSESREGPEGRAAGLTQPITLAPHQTQVINIRPFLMGNPSGPSAGGLTISHSGAPGDVLMHGMLSDRDGFSANVRFHEPETLTSLNLNGPIYHRGEAKPIVLLSNTGNEASSVEMTARFRLNGEKQERVLWTAVVGPRNATHVDLSQPMQSLPSDASEIALILKDTQLQSGILADVLLVDNSGSGVLQMFPKGYSGEVHPSHGFPFRIDGSLNTIVTVANPSDTEEIQYSLHLYYDGGTYTYDDTILLPGETKHIDIGELRDRAIPGQRKAVLPRSVKFRQGKVHFRPKKGTGQPVEALVSQSPSVSGGGHHGGHPSGGVAGATIFDSTGKLSFGTICEPICILEVWEVNGSIEGVVGSSYSVGFEITLFDGGTLFVDDADIEASGYNSSIVDVHQESAQTVIDLIGVGETEIDYTAAFDLTYYGCGDCGYGRPCSVPDGPRRNRGDSDRARAPRRGWGRRIAVHNSD